MRLRQAKRSQPLLGELRLQRANLVAPERKEVKQVACAEAPARMKQLERFGIFGCGAGQLVSENVELLQ